MVSQFNPFRFEAEVKTEVPVTDEEPLVAPVENFNPNHDELGRFAEGSGGGRGENAAEREYRQEMRHLKGKQELAVGGGDTRGAETKESAVQRATREKNDGRKYDKMRVAAQEAYVHSTRASGSAEKQVRYAEYKRLSQEAETFRKKIGLRLDGSYEPPHL